MRIKRDSGLYIVCAWRLLCRTLGVGLRGISESHYQSVSSVHIMLPFL